MAKPKAKTQGKAPEAPMVAVASRVEGFKTTRRITMPTLTMKDASPARVLRFDSRMELSTYVDPDPKKKLEKPATVANVTDMKSGEVFKFLVPSVVESNLRRDYDAEVKVVGVGKDAKITEDDGKHDYVAKCFLIQCMGKRANKRYRDFSIEEVEAE